MAEGGVCAVVGVGPGLGLALCRRFGREGYPVAMLARSAEKLAGYRDALTGAGVPEARGYAADAGSPRSLSDAFGEVRETLGEPEVMVYNAVGFHPGPLGGMSPEDLGADAGVSTVGALTAAQEVLPPMREHDRGTLLFTGGGAAIYPSASYASLTVGKAALRAVALCLADELEDTGIRVSTVTIFGSIQPDTHFDPDLIAERYWEAHTDGQVEAEIPYR